MKAMKAKHSDPEILTDFSRLPEIYKLRVYAWEHSPGKENINSTKFPNGYSDHLEHTSIHFISKNEQDEIIGCCRLSVCMSLDDLPYPNIFKTYEQKIAKDRPFLFYSRMAIRPEHRKMGLSKKFDALRIGYQQKEKIPFGLVTVEPKRMEQLIEKGFKIIGLLKPGLDEHYPYIAEIPSILMQISL